MRPSAALAVAAFFGAALRLSLLTPPGLPERTAPGDSTLYRDRHGRHLSERVGPLEHRQLPVRLADVSPNYIAALLAAEDRRFFSHGGIDLLSVARAMRDNAVSLRVVGGGSTLTQQLARLLYAEERWRMGRSAAPRSLWQKLIEAHLTLRLEHHNSKERILESFINRVPLGGGTLGLASAAERYFATGPSALSLGQAATLAALTKGPSYYDAFSHRDRLEARRDWVLRRMVAVGSVSSAQLERAKAEGLKLQGKPAVHHAPHAIALARRTKREARGIVDLTIDAELQGKTEQIVQEELARIYRRGARSAAVVVLETQSGDVLAAVGSGFEDNPIWGAFSAITAERQPGSALKPFLYATALESGHTAASIAADIEKPFSDTWGVYKPKNYDERYHGPVRYRAALAQSLNVAAVDVLSRVGLEPFYRKLDAFGLSTLERRPGHYGLGLTLGSAPVRLLDLANAYAALARGGVLDAWHIFADAPWRSPDRPRRVLGEREAYVVGDILSDSNARADQFGIDSVLSPPYWAAAKTGTSKGYRDTWTFGFSDRFVVGVWVGDPSGKPMQELSGSTGAGVIWRRVMDQLTQGRSSAPKAPSGLVRRRVCAVSGLLEGPHCEGGLEEWFRHEHVPDETCEIHQKPRLATTDGGVVPRGCAAPSTVSPVSLALYPSPFGGWAERSEKGRAYRVSSACEQRSGDRVHVELLSPSRRETLRLDSDLPASRQRLPLKAHVAGSTAPVTFLVDGEPLATVEPPYETTWPLTVGEHRVQARVGTSTSAAHIVRVY